MKKFTFLLVILLLITGCQAVNPFSLASPIITGIIKWQEGEATKYYDGNLETVYKSVILTLKEMNLSINKNELSNNGYYILAGKNNQFKIKIKEEQPNIIKVSIRVNFMGDKPLAELVYKHIDKNLDIIEFDKGQPIKH